MRNRLAGIFWSILFLAVPVLGVGVFAIAPSIDVWLPKDVSSHGKEIDSLFYFILALTGIVFIVTEMLLFWFIWKYDAAARGDEKATYIHGSHTLEVIWTIIPAVTMLFLAIYQMNAWADMKMRRPVMKPTVEVVRGSSSGGCVIPAPMAILALRTICFWSMTCMCQWMKTSLFSSRAWMCCTVSSCQTFA